jgi:hypothetical protein
VLLQVKPVGQVPQLIVPPQPSEAMPQLLRVPLLEPQACVGVSDWHTHVPGPPPAPLQTNGCPHVPQLIMLPQPSETCPHVFDPQASCFDLEVQLHTPGPPLALPQTPASQTPQLTVPPQPSGALPQLFEPQATDARSGTQATQVPVLLHIVPAAQLPQL